MGGTIDIFRPKTQTSTQRTSYTFRIRTYVDLPLVPKQATQQSKVVAHRRIRGRRQCPTGAAAPSNQSQAFHYQARAGMSGCFVVVNSKGDASRVVLPPRPGLWMCSCLIVRAVGSWQRRKRCGSCGHASKGPSLPTAKRYVRR